MSYASSSQRLSNRTTTVDVPFDKIGGIGKVEDSRVYPGYWTVTIGKKQDPSGSRSVGNFAEVVQEKGTTQPNQDDSVRLDFATEAESAYAFLSEPNQ